MRTAYRCRAYPGEQQQVMLNRTFGCVRVLWNQALAARYPAGRASTSYAQMGRALTVLKRDPGLAWLGEMSCVPLQQALRHQHAAFGAFFAKQARYDRDINAAKNILAAGLAAAVSQDGDACGADVRHGEATPVQSAVKQEPRPARAGIPAPQGEE